MELEAMAPTHSSLSVSGNPLEYLIGVSPEIMAYRYHRGIYECYASTSPESSQINPNQSLDHKSSKLLVFVLFPNRFYFLVGILPVFVT